MNRRTILLLFIFIVLIASMHGVISTRSGEIGGLHYVHWSFLLDRFKWLYIDISILSEPSNDDGLYFQMYQGTINGEGFYFGLQTQTYKPGFGSMGKGLIFSRWGTRDLSNVRIVEGGWAESSGHEGDFVGVRRTYNWTTHNYRLEIGLNDTDAVGDWYGVWILDVDYGTRDLLGAIRFPNVSADESGIADRGVTWTELYWKADPETPIPCWNLSILGIYVTQHEVPPSKAKSTYSQINNTDIYCDENKTIHLIMNPYMTRTHPPSVLYWVGDITGPDDQPDGKCDMRDVGLVATYFGQTAPPAPADCDVTGPTTRIPDGKIDMRDIGLVARQFGETDP